MLDSYCREINYIRMSLTGRCQQRCTYCVRENGGVCIKERELSAEDFVFAASVFGLLGFKKLRLTGGEPLLRKDILEIVGGISALGCYDDLALTTNGVLLRPLCEPLKAAGLRRINISLDSTDAAIYNRITGASLEPVLEGLYKAIETFDTVKLNAVLIKNINDRPDGLLAIARDYPVTVRFIELMPMGGRGEGVSQSELLSRYPFLEPVPKADAHSPEMLYSAPGFKGRVGFISPMSCTFCPACNRLRLTWDGRLRPCLGVDSELDARAAIIDRDEGALRRIIETAVVNKPLRNEFNNNFSSSRPMTGIGG